ncbi:MAG: PAS domain-containing protein, partial [Hyphomicrobiales bacterium]
MCKGKTDKADPARRRAAMIGAVVLAAALDAPAAGAAALSPATLSWRPGAEGPVFLVIASIAAVAVLWAVFATVRAAQREREMRRQLNALQSERDEAERVLRSEPQLLFIWRGRNATPEHIVAQMCGLCAIPETREKQADFAAWIAPESWVRLGCALGALRKTGHMFNIAIKTMAGERLEADGRTAGGLVTLRLRPLVGERLVLNELEAKHRALGRRAGRLETLLDAAPLAIWLRRDDGRIAWANNAYIRAVDGEALEQVVGQTMTLTGEGQDSADEKPAKRRDDGRIAWANNAYIRAV